MSEYYNAIRTKGLYVPESTGPFRISRSKIELFLECAKCFYLDRKLGVSRPPGFPFALNSAVDKLLKQEFDIHRAQGTKHPLMQKYGVDAVPVKHEDLDKWRHNFTGIQHLHRSANFLVFGAIDDLWARKLDSRFRGNDKNEDGNWKKEVENNSPEYIVVDYKSTSKDEEIKELNKSWQDGYKRQMEIYQWLLRQNGYKVSDTGYFVYCNGQTDKKAFDAKLEFEITLIPYKGSDTWVEKTLHDIYKSLNSSTIPKANKNCDYCAYREAAKEKENE